MRARVTDTLSSHVTWKEAMEHVELHLYWCLALCDHCFLLSGGSIPDPNTNFSSVLFSNAGQMCTKGRIYALHPS